MRARAGWVMVAASLAVLVTTGSASAQAGGGQAVTADEYQRSAEIYAMKTTAKSGPQRGEEIYYYKCWFCHNKFQKTGPLLRDLYKRPRLLTGPPVNDQTVAEKIRQGGPLMPAYYRYTLSEADMADLLSYLRAPRSSDVEDEPPPNPRYPGGR